MECRDYNDDAICITVETSHFLINGVRPHKENPLDTHTHTHTHAQCIVDAFFAHDSAGLVDDSSSDALKRIFFSKNNVGPLRLCPVLMITSPNNTFWNILPG